MWRRPAMTILMLIVAVIPALPARGERNVAPTLRSAGADLKVSATAQGISSSKRFTQDQVSSMVRDGFGDESGAKLIEQRGIDFTPSEDFIQTLKAAGASEAFLKALSAAKPPEPAGPKKPINQVQVFALLVGQVPSHRVSMLVQERGIDFEPTDDYFQEVRLAGGEDELVSALKTAKVTKPATVDPAAQARQTEIRQHVARGAQLLLAKRDAEAEGEFRAAVRLSPGNAVLHAAYGMVLERTGDLDGAATECRTAVRLNPSDAMLHAALSEVLAGKGDLDGAIMEQREALRLDPSDGKAHYNLRVLYQRNGNLDGAIGEYREALRLNPNNAETHENLGFTLGLGKDDWDSAITEFHEALRLNPNLAEAYVGLARALGQKDDLDGAIAELREALRIDPNNGDAHFGLGAALETKDDRPGALEEYRAAYLLDPKNATYKQNYDRLLQQMNQ